MSVNFKEGEPVEAGQLLASIDPGAYRFEAAQAEAVLARDKAALAELVATRKEMTPPSQYSAMTAQIESTIKSDQAKVENAMLQVTSAQVRAPIAGVAGLRWWNPAISFTPEIPTVC